jgi:hypothetical protein
LIAVPNEQAARSTGTTEKLVYVNEQGRKEKGRKRGSEGMRERELSQEIRMY